jgi:tripartite-type tricarboxylate transporter receptor subunit TctC
MVASGAGRAVVLWSRDDRVAGAGVRAAAIPGEAAGHPDFELKTWTGVMMPAGVPPAIMTTLREATVRIISEPAYVERQAQSGAEIAPCTPEEMRQIQLAEIQLYAT